MHAEAETDGKRAMISFGPVYAPLGPRQISQAIAEANTLVPKPDVMVFAALHFDPEAEKDLDGLKWPGITIIKAQMNADLLTGDLKKHRTSNESFWLLGEPDIKMEKVHDKHIVTVRGFDYYNTITGKIEQGTSSRIAMWLLDTDYDGRSIYAQQTFFPGDNSAWSALEKTLGSKIDQEMIEKYSGTVSIPFEPGSNKKVAVKIIDDRGLESLRILDVK